MGIGMAIIIDPLKVNDVKTILAKLTPVFEIGKITSGNKDVVIA
jgi:phosphoribosylaminoimidazole (AIR) synthetase